MLQFQPWKAALVALVCAMGVVYALPNVIERDLTRDLPSWLPGKKINLGLDLQGGSHLLLEVDVDVVVTERLEAIVDQTRRNLRQERIGYRGLGVVNDAVLFTVRKTQDLDKARDAVRRIDPETVLETDAGNTVRIMLTEVAMRDLKARAIAQSIEIVRRRIDETGVREPTIQRQGEDRILLQLPGIDDPERIKALLGQTAKLTFRMVDSTASVQDALQGRVPPGSQLLPAVDDRPGALQHYVVKRRVMVSGENLVDAQPSFQDGQPVVSFRFDTVGGRRFGKATTENVGRPFAIVLDGKVISAPVIQTAILGGAGIISGNFTVQEVQDLSLLLRAGALPAPLQVLEERTVGPGLGADSIAAGKFASAIGLLLVIVFMIVTYGLFGVLANVALFFNMTLIVAILSSLQATLTLPGIAGIVLTVGMAVDANVLIFERIREEIRNGQSPMASIELGYQRAFRTILDANLTTLFAALFLYFMGSGPVKGFAVTLGIGILTSLFTATLVSRLFIQLWMRRSRPSELPI